MVLPVSASSGFSDSMWEKNLYDPIVSFCESITLIRYHELFTNEELNKLTSYEKRKFASERIINIFNKYHLKKKYDLFFTYLNNTLICEEALKSIPENVLKINYTTNFHQFDLYKSLIEFYDVNIYVSKDAKSEFERLARKSYYMPFASNPILFDQQKNELEHYSFVGTAHGDRAFYCWRILQNNIPFNIYGVNWKINNKKKYLRPLEVLKNSYFGDSPIESSYKLLREQIINKINIDYPSNIHNPVSDIDYVNLLHNSKGVINIPESRYDNKYSNPKVLLGANLRDFEVPMANGLLFTQRNDEIMNFFTEGKEVVMFSGILELIDKLKFYQKHDNLANAISLAGNQRAKTQHTWEHRFNDFFNFLEKEVL